MWCPDDKVGYGLIDFQDAFWGFEGYDLLNLLEDARVSVPLDIKEAVKNQYCAEMSATERKIFDDWYILLSTHFHFRVIGLFVKFSREKGTSEFLTHIPRLQNYIKENLKNPLLSPLKEWIEQNNVSFNIDIK
jgi:aminoglycoside/choline kinase family phosphotransferase